MEGFTDTVKTKKRFLHWNLNISQTGIGLQGPEHPGVSGNRDDAT